MLHVLNRDPIEELSTVPHRGNVLASAPTLHQMANGSPGRSLESGRGFSSVRMASVMARSPHTSLPGNGATHTTLSVLQILRKRGASSWHMQPKLCIFLNECGTPYRCIHSILLLLFLMSCSRGAFVQTNFSMSHLWTYFNHLNYPQSFLFLC